MLAFDRRHFLSSLSGAAGALLVGPGHDRNSIHAAGTEPKPEIRITDVKTAMLEADWGWRRRWMLTATPGPVMPPGPMCWVTDKCSWARIPRRSRGCFDG